MIFNKKLIPFKIIIFTVFVIVAFLVVINQKSVFPIPVLLPGEYILDASGDIDVGRWAVPLVYDWDSDGRKDLLVGQRLDEDKARHGYVSFFKNIGTDSDPRFDKPSFLKTDGGCCLDVPVDG